MDLFHLLDIGKVSRVDLVKLNNNKNGNYFKGYVHFETWYESTIARNIQAAIKENIKPVKLVYDDPKYWILKENISKDYIKIRTLENKINMLNRQLDTNSKYIEEIMQMMTLENNSTKRKRTDLFQ